MTGESGTGKSTLIRAVMSEISAERISTSLVFNPTVKADEFLELTMLDFGLQPVPATKPQRLAMLNEFLLENQRNSKITTLFIDEAHTLTTELLEEIRLLTNFETAESKLLQIVMAGHTELDDMLERHELRQLKQRIAVRISLLPLSSADEVGRYMNHRWQRAGSQMALPFTAEAITSIALYSGGIPRTVNALCDNALLNAFGAGNLVIGASVIQEVAKDLRLKASLASSSDLAGSAVLGRDLDLPTLTPALPPLLIDDLGPELPPPTQLEVAVPRFRTLGSKS
jgi:type II secretory pathway predicted ATPase ExeA